MCFFAGRTVCGRMIVAVVVVVSVAVVGFFVAVDVVDVVVV